MTRFLLAAAAVMSLSINVSAQGVKKVSLQGEWEIVAMTKHGKPAPPEALAEAFIRIAATTLVPINKATNAEVSGSKMTYQVVGAKDVNFFEVKNLGAGGPPPVQVLKPGIFEMTGDTLKLCWSEDVPGLKDKKGKVLVPAMLAKRPTSFDGGLAQFSMVLKRKK
jgi:uncharacterized protein (TIGR03067 family)